MKIQHNFSIISFVSSILLAGCASKVPSNVQISFTPYAHNFEEKEIEHFNVMSFRIHEGKNPDFDLQSEIETCAAENTLRFSNNSLVPFPVSYRAMGGVEAGMNMTNFHSPGAVIELPTNIASGIIAEIIVSSYEKVKAEILPYKLIQRCMENKGYFCEGFCPDSEQTRQNNIWNLGECLEDLGTYDDDSRNTCYQADRTLLNIKKHGLPRSNTPVLLTKCGFDQGVISAYLAHNIWVRNKDRQFFVNYKDGTLLPISTKVINIRLMDSTTISFQVEDTCENIDIHFDYKMHPGKTIVDYYNLMFTNKSFEQLTKGIESEAIDAIQNGKTIKGMSKRAVLLTYGYPPEDLTPDLENNSVWVYWRNNYFTELLNFDESGRLDYSRPLYGRPTINYTKSID